MFQNATIAAISTPSGVGGIAVIRISGDRATQLVDGFFRGKKKLADCAGYTCTFGSIYVLQQDDKLEILDSCIATVFRAPHSYTGEDVVELSVHGGIYIARRVLSLCIEFGAVPAGPGEFTKRAFLAGKLSLSQAEAVIDLIHAEGETAAKIAVNSYTGALNTKLLTIEQKLCEIAAHLAAWVDYPEEDIILVRTDEILESLETIFVQLKKLLSTFETACIVRSGINTVIAGKPNVGKSSIMNLLAGYDRSIVTPIAGTTRDVITESITIDGVAVNLFDTAGIHESIDTVEKVGMKRATDQIEHAQIVLAVFDSSVPLTPEDIEVARLCENKASIAVLNKGDLMQQLKQSELQPYFEHIIKVSAKTGEHLDELREKISSVVGLKGFDPYSPTISTERQRYAIIATIDQLQTAMDAIRDKMPIDIISVCIESVIASLMELSGRSVTGELVDQVFSQFCVGK